MYFEQYKQSVQSKRCMSVIVEFPSVETADPESGMLAFGGDLEVASLELAYRSGIFPWPSSENEPILWFAPPRRAILEFDSLHIPKRLVRALKKDLFTFKVNNNFQQVITACANNQNRKNQSGTWITSSMISAYINFHNAGFAHCFETYNAGGKLVGGMYGVLIGKYFAGESMFYLENNASKFTLLNAASHLKNLGLTWMDIQMLTPLLTSFGAVEVPRPIFMKKLHKALNAL